MELSEKGAPSSTDEGEGEDEDSTQEGREEGGAGNPKKWWMKLWGKRCKQIRCQTAMYTSAERYCTVVSTSAGVLFPQLSLHDGCDVLSPGRSTLVVAILYASHTLSAWVCVGTLPCTEELAPLLGYGHSCHHQTLFGEYVPP